MMDTRRLARAANPFRDLDDIILVQQWRAGEQGSIEGLRQYITRGFWHIGRGAVYGAILGGVTSLVTDTSPAEGASVGAWGGAALDYVQFKARILVEGFWPSPEE